QRQMCIRDRAAPTARVAGDGQVNVRSGPGTAYGEAGQVATGTEMEIISSNAAGDWYEVCCVNGQNVWIVARLVEVTGDPALIQVAQNIPAPPTATVAPTRPPVVVQPPAPAQPTQPPAPVAPPAPAFRFTKYSMEPRPNSNPIVSVFGGLYNSALDLSNPVTGYKLVVQAPSGEQKEEAFGPAFLRGDAGYPSEFLFNAKIEFMSASEGVYRAWVADAGGNQVSEAYDLGASGETRTFIVRWKE
ncbi:MAG: SH3 domain-containing protein, partial [Anaerolinea sp.]|nr:SH3 domain-containing protein [Anaerolinea sp.]